MCEGKAEWDVDRTMLRGLIERLVDEAEEKDHLLFLRGQKGSWTEYQDRFLDDLYAGKEPPEEGSTGGGWEFGIGEVIVVAAVLWATFKAAKEVIDMIRTANDVYGWFGQMRAKEAKNPNLEQLHDKWRRQLMRYGLTRKEAGTVVDRFSSDFTDLVARSLKRK